MTGEFKASFLAKLQPWLLYSDSLAFRGSADKIPFHTLSKLAHCSFGCVSLVLVPVAKILKMGSSLASYNATLQGLTPAAAKKHLSEVATIVHLQAKETLWEPYGTLAWMITTSQTSFLAVVPILSEAIVKNSDKGVHKNTGEYLNEFLKVATVEPWPSLAKNIRSFLGVQE